MNAPTLRYAQRDGVSLAYQVDGNGPDLVVFPGATSTTWMWEDREGRAFFDSLRDRARLITFDQRGAGRSDPLLANAPLPLEERLTDAQTVMEAAGASRPYLLAFHDGGPVALLAVATHPEEFAGLILLNTAPRLAWAPDFTQGFDQQLLEAFLEEMPALWGTGSSANLWAPSAVSTPQQRDRWARMEQAQCSPSQLVLQSQQTNSTDARHLLELISIPTLVVQRSGDLSLPAHNGRYLADRIQDATLLELPGDDHFPFTGDNRLLVAAIQGFLALPQQRPKPLTRLSAVVFTDIVDSTQMVTEMGDERWVRLLDAHDHAARLLAERHKGRLVKSTGDGTLAVFDGPIRAMRYALDLRHDVAELGLRMRAGVHAGEVQGRDDDEDVAGLAVHAAARVAALAPPDQVYVSRTVTDLVAGIRELAFEPQGSHELKGLAGSWELFEVRAPSDG